jgi:hypothetical protein
MKRVFAIIGAIVTGALGPAVILPNVVEAGRMVN